MKQWLIQLYPKPWRERYGEEFLVLLEQESFTFRTILDILRGAFDAHWNDLVINQPEHISFTFTLRFRKELLRRIVIIFLCYSMSYVGFRSTDVLVRHGWGYQHHIVATWPVYGYVTPLTIFYMPLSLVETSVWPVVHAATVRVMGPSSEVPHR